jgi:hypothetical protein
MWISTSWSHVFVIGHNFVVYACFALGIAAISQDANVLDKAESPTKTFCVLETPKLF